MTQIDDLYAQRVRNLYGSEPVPLNAAEMPTISPEDAARVADMYTRPAVVAPIDASPLAGAKISKPPTP